MTSRKNSAIVEEVTSITSDLLTTIFVQDNNPPNSRANDFRYDRIKNHINKCYGKDLENLNGMCLTFDKECEWINVDSPPDLTTEAKSNIIILEFFTHCCINCVHSINQLRKVLEEVEKERAEGLSKKDGKCCGFKVVSVHSPKFLREQDPDSLRAFIEKMSMNHSVVVNDPNRKLWEELKIFCWPTILVFGPNPNPQLPNTLNLIFSLIGEASLCDLKFLLNSSAKHFDTMFTFNPGNSSVEVLNKFRDAPKSNGLLYPGKISINPDGDLLAISDSGNNRIVIVTTDGIVQELIGNQLPGFQDGSFHEAKFSNPQGVVFDGNSVLFVAETGNHAIRRVDLNSKEVTTLVAPDTLIQAEGNQNLMKSPWDLAFYSRDPKVLLISAAGNHQILGYFFQPIQLFRQQHEAGIELVAGTGREENRNNSYILKSSFAQPSGIYVASNATNEKLVFIADSESSTVRMIDPNGSVVGLVGGGRDPTDLFAFGDEDGIKFQAKLQHPVGVCSNADGSKVYIADTYNHKIKIVEMETKRCSTLIGNGTAGNRSGSFNCVIPKRRHSGGRKSPDSPYALLNEPGGLCINSTGDLLYIADTNNHTIKIASITDMTVHRLDIIWDVVDSSVSKIHNPTPQPVLPNQIVFEVTPGKFKEIEIKVRNFPKNIEGGEWKILSSTTGVFIPVKSGAVKLHSEEDKMHGTILLHDVDFAPTAELIVEVLGMLCGSSTCYARKVNFAIRVKQESNSNGIDSNNETLSFIYEVNEDAFKE